MLTTVSICSEWLPEWKGTEYKIHKSLSFHLLAIEICQFMFMEHRDVLNQLLDVAVSLENQDNLGIRLSNRYKQVLQELKSTDIYTHWLPYLTMNGIEDQDPRSRTKAGIIHCDIDVRVRENSLIGLTMFFMGQLPFCDDSKMYEIQEMEAFELQELHQVQKYFDSEAMDRLGEEEDQDFDLQYIMMVSEIDDLANESCSESCQCHGLDSDRISSKRIRRGSRTRNPPMRYDPSTFESLGMELAQRERLKWLDIQNFHEDWKVFLNIHVHPDDLDFIQLEFLELEQSVKPKKIDRKTYQQYLTTTCYDFIELDQVSVSSHLEADRYNNVVIFGPKTDTQPLGANSICFSKRHLMDYTQDAHSVFFNRVNNDYIDSLIPVVAICLSQMTVYVPMVDIHEAIEGSALIFEIQTTEIVFHSTCSLSDGIMSIITGVYKAGSPKLISRLAPIVK